MTPFETIARLVEAIKYLIIGGVVMAAIIVATLVCMSVWHNYLSASSKSAAMARLEKSQYQCGEYGNGRAWTAAKRSDFLAKTGGSDGR